MSTYLLDADTLISAKNDWYRFKVCPGFWEWILAANGTGSVFSIEAIEDDLKKMNDDLAEWVKNDATGLFQKPDSSVMKAAAQVSDWVMRHTQYEAQARNEFFAASDFWLCAHALARGHVLVTRERPDPKSRRRVKIPDVCDALGISWMSPFQMLDMEGARFVLG